MVTELNNISQLEQAMKPKDSDYQVGLYELVTDDLCIRVRSTSEIYVSVRVFTPLVVEENIKYLKPNSIDESDISDSLSELISLINSQTKEEIDGFEYKETNDLDESATFHTFLERLE